MTKNSWTVAALAVTLLSSPLFAVDMHGGFAPEAPQTIARLPTEASISILPSAIVHVSPSLLADIPGPGPNREIKPSASWPKAGQADVQAMISPKAPIVPSGQDVSKMSDDQAAGAGEAIMDRILYIKGTPASGSAAVAAGSQSAAPSQLNPARRGPVGLILAAPIKAVKASTDYWGKKTKSPFWTAYGLALLNMGVAAKLMVLNGYFRTSAEMSGWRVGAVLGFLVISMLYMGYGSAIDKANTEAKTARKLNESAAKAQDSLKTHPGVLSVYGDTVPGKNGNDRFIIVKVSELTAKNLNKIPLSIDGFPVKVQFAR